MSAMACIRLVMTAALAYTVSPMASHQLRGTSFLGLRYSPEDPGARTLVALDTNSDGRIDPQEIASFARSNNMDAAAATQEFSSIDVNGDGVLDTSELQQVFGTGVQATAAPVVPAPSQVASIEAAPQQQTVAGRQAGPVTPLESSALTSLATVDEVPRQVAPAEATPEQIVAERPLELGTPVERSVPTSLTTVDDVNPKSSIQDVAQHVSDQLSLEEAEERKARDLDTQAAAARAKFTMLAKTTEQDALQAGVEAAQSKTQEMLDVLTGLEEQASRAEVKGAALRAKSQMEVDEANELMSLANKAFQRELTN
jgi:hypothetical protein